jgi:HipA-like protein
MKRLKSKFFWKVEGMDYDDNSSSNSAVFHLKYDGITIGILSFCDEQWHFKYTSDFMNLGLAPLSNFPDINKDYSSDKLWPFFASRIPSLNQPFYNKKINIYNINVNDSVDLLKHFGKRTITNPYQLDFV